MSIEIKPNGVVEYAGIQNDQRWRTTIAPGDTARAKELLSVEELAEVQAAWTPAIVTAYQVNLAANQLPVDDTPQPTAEQQIADLKAAVIELAEKGQITTATLTKLKGVEGTAH